MGKTLHEMIRELSLLEAKLGGGTPAVIVTPNGGEWNVGDVKKAKDSDGDLIIAIVPEDF